jgi:hypothetical protein
VGARAQLAVALTAALPRSVHIVDNPAADQTSDAVVVQLVRTSVRRHEKAPRGQWLAAFDIWVVVPHLDTADGGEDVLDDALDDVLEVIDANDWLLWEQAERTNYSDGRAAYRITATLTTKVEAP